MSCTRSTEAADDIVCEIPAGRRFTRLSHDDEVGVKWYLKRGCFAKSQDVLHQPARP